MHLQLVGDPARPLVEGNHVFLSVSARDDGFAPAGLRTWTASTHVDPRSPPERIAAIQGEVRRRIAEQAPEWSATVHERTASPPTFERFTRRAGGWVGGVPRRAGRASYRGLWPRPVAPGLWLVGDATFPGQSTLSAAAGGERVARAAFELQAPEQPRWYWLEADRNARCARPLGVE